MFKLVLVSALLAVAYARSTSISNRPSLETKVVGGEEVTIEKFPYQVVVLYFEYYICSGTLISNKHVLTSVGCVIDEDPLIFSIRAGSANYFEGGIIRNVLDYEIHPDFAKNDYNIAILLLRTVLEFNDKIQPIALPKRFVDVKVGTDVVTSGWGNLIEGSEKPRILHAVTVQVISNSDCQTKWGSSGTITDRMLCATTAAGGKDVCDRDDGNPLVANGVLVGIASWGYGCGDRNQPSVYANVSHLRDFISGVTGI